MKRSVIYALLFFISIGESFSQIKEESSLLLDSIVKSIRSKENLTIDWETGFMYGKELDVNIHHAKIKGAKYHHKSKDVTIICDGQFVYKYFGKSNEQSISHVDTTADYNPIKVLTFFGSGYRTKRIKKYKSGKISSIRIETIDSKANLIKEAFLYFDKQSGLLSDIKFKTTGKFVNYVKIKSLDSTVILSDSEFVIPK